MHIGVVSDSLVEKIALSANLAAEPLLATQMAFTMARSIMASVELGLFEALVQGERTAAEVAKDCATMEKPTKALLKAMASCGYLDAAGIPQRFSLKPVARKWLVRTSEHNICDKLLFQNLEWRYMEQLVPYARTGVPIDLHAGADNDQWRSYQKGMADIGKLALPEVVRRMPIPKGAKRMLDIGGSGGTYSSAFVKSRPGLQSVILDLPDAVAHARPLVEGYGLPKETLDIQAGNVLEADLGSSCLDFAFMANVAHHLSDEQNRLAARKVAAALASGGVFCILEIIRTELPTKKAQLGALLDVYFGLTSQSGTWTVAEISSWLLDAGLTLMRPIALRTAPGIVAVLGRKP